MIAINVQENKIYFQVPICAFLPTLSTV